MIAVLYLRLGACLVFAAVVAVEALRDASDHDCECPPRGEDGWSWQCPCGRWWLHLGGGWQREDQPL